MAPEVIVFVWYILLILLPLHAGLLLALRKQNKRRRDLLMALWKMGSKLGRRR